MLAKLVERLPEAGGWLYEPKMGRFRVLLFRDDREWLLQSRDLKPPESLLSRARIHDLGATTFTSGGRRRGCHRRRGRPRLRGPTAPRPPGSVARQASFRREPGLARAVGSLVRGRRRSPRSAVRGPPS